VVATYTPSGGSLVTIPPGDTFCPSTPCAGSVPLGYSDQGSPLNFGNVLSNATQTLSVQLSCGSCSIGTTIQVIGSPAWLHVTTGGDSGSTLLTNVQVQTSPPTTLNVKVNTSTLTTGSTYNGAITITGPPNTAPVTVNVTVTVGGSTILSSNPSSLSFTALQGSNVGSPSSTVTQVFSSGAQLNYFSNASTTDGHNWLLLVNPNGTTGGTGITVSVNPSALAAGNYTGAITVQSTSTGDSLSIPVFLTVTANATLSVTPTTLSPFLYQIGQSFPASQQLNVVSNTGTLNFSVTSSPVVSWLIISPTFSSASTTATPVTLSVNPSGLSAGNYSTTVFVSPNGQAPVAAIPVSLVVSSNPLLKLSSTALTYTAQFAGLAPADQQVQVTTSGGSGTVGFTASSDSSWLSVNPTSGTASSTATTLTIHVNPQSLQVGNYTGVITVHPTNGDQYSETISVTLTVGSASQLYAGPSQLLFSYELGLNTPLPQLVQVTSLGQPATFTLTTSTSNCGTGWLGVTPSSLTTPATLSVSVVTSGMVAGTCSGNVVISYNNGTGTTTLSVPVTVNVSNNGTPLLSVGFPQTTNGFGLEIVQQNASPINRIISLTSTDTTQVSFAVNTFSSPTTWLFAAAQGTTTPQTLTVQINPSGLAPGTYNGTLQIFSNGLPSGALNMPITLIVNSSVTVAVAPSTLSFTQPQGSNVPLAAQTITLTSSGGSGASFTANPTTNQGGSWLKVSSSSGSIGSSTSITASVDPAVASTLSLGTYTGQISFAFQNAATVSATVQVSLTITQAQTVNPPTPSSLSFAWTVGSAAPPSQTLSVTSTGGPVQISVGTVSTGWTLTATPTSGATPQTITVTASTQGITAAANLTGTVTISAPGVLANPIQVPVTFTVTGVPPPQNLAVTGNANNIGGAVAPGELITIKGANLGPATPVNFTVNSQGRLDPTLGGVQVLFDGIPGTPYYVSSTQINVTVPYEIAGRLSTNITVTYQGQTSTPIQQSVLATAPAIFTLNGLGTGQAWVRNQSGSINGPVGGVNTSGGVVQTTPESANLNRVISLIATGGGATSPASATGSVNPTSPPFPVVNNWTLGSSVVTATIGGVNAPVQFAGAYPGLITGLIQINLTVPNGVTGNALPIVITINGQPSLSGASAPTMAVQ